VSSTGQNVAGEIPAEEPDAVTDEATVQDDDVELERTIGLTGGLAIGIGTMIGAGIFVFPGLAAENAGLAATLSFAIGGVIALLVALPTSELATAMPRSGGGYFFISRAMGTAYGAIVGLGLWLGLVFASAFYLVGLGHYATAVLDEVGVALSVNPVIAIGVVFGAGLTALSIGGTENTAKLQNGVVGILLVVLTGFLSYGVPDAVGCSGAGPSGDVLLPGVRPGVDDRCARVHVVSRVRPGRDRRRGDQAPRAKPPAGDGRVRRRRHRVLRRHHLRRDQRLRRGPAGQLRGDGDGRGRPAFSRTARCDSDPVCRTAGDVLQRERVDPQRLAGGVRTEPGRPAPAPGERGEPPVRHAPRRLARRRGPILVLVATGEVELLAEVASFLHLVMYGLICVALIIVRRREPVWYDPTFRTPAYPLVPAVGALASFGLIAFMQRASIAIGVAVMVASYLWYRYYAGDVVLEGDITAS